MSFNYAEILREKQRGKCCYCDTEMLFLTRKQKTLLNSKLPKITATKEHLRRKCEGGSSILDNLALACHECNSGRGSIDWLSYKSLKMGELT